MDTQMLSKANILFGKIDCHSMGSTTKKKNVEKVNFDITQRQ